MSDFTGLISAEFKQLHVDMITETIRGFSVTCQAIYGGSKYQDCANCTNGNVYTSGGPAPFTFGVCPVCQGTAKIEVEATENVSLAPIYANHTLTPLASHFNIQNPDCDLMTVSLIATYPVLKRVKELIVNTDIITYVKGRYERAANPEPCGFGGEFIITKWKRVGNG